MITNEWVVQRRVIGKLSWEDQEILPDTLMPGELCARFKEYVNSNTDPNLEFRMIVRRETVVLRMDQP
jgi:hypothetical protein